MEPSKEVRINDPTPSTQTQRLFMHQIPPRPYNIRSLHVPQSSAPCPCIQSESFAIILTETWSSTYIALLHYSIFASRCTISIKCPILPPCHLSAPFFTSNFTFLALSVIFLSPLLFNSLYPLPPLSLFLLPLSSVPRGYYLSRRQICPIIKLIPSFSSSQPLQLPRSSSQFYRRTEAKAGKTPFLS